MAGLDPAIALAARQRRYGAPEDRAITGSNPVMTPFEGGDDGEERSPSYETAPSIARSLSTMKSRTIGTASRSVDSKS